MPLPGVISYDRGRIISFSEGIRKQAHSEATWLASRTSFVGTTIDELSERILARLRHSVSISDFTCFMGNIRDFDMYTIYST